MLNIEESFPYMKAIREEKMQKINTHITTSLFCQNVDIKGKYKHQFEPLKLEATDERNSWENSYALGVTWH